MPSEGVPKDAEVRLGITIQFVWVVSGWGGQANDLGEFGI